MLMFSCVGVLRINRRISEIRVSDFGFRAVVGPVNMEDRRTTVYQKST